MASRFQFSIRFLLAATVAVAAGAAIASAERSISAALATHCLTLLFATATVVGAYQTTGNVRVFWIGTAIVLCPLAFFAVQMQVYVMQQQEMGMGGNPVYYFKVWPMWCAAPVNGLFAVFLHWLFAPRQNPPA